MEDNWDESSVAAEDEDIDDSDEDIFTDEFDYDDDSLLNNCAPHSRYFQ